MKPTDDRKADIQALEAELRGIDTELAVKAPMHRSLSIAIERLEADKNEIIYRIYRLKREARK